MSYPRPAAVAAVGASLSLAAPALAQQTDGPDIVVSAVNGAANYAAADEIDAFAVGYALCNIGDTPVVCLAHTNDHPADFQHLYRLRSGRFEQIGQSWGHQGFFMLSQGGCASVPCEATDGQTLGIGCSDPVTAARAGSQHGLGPKFQVNGTTGVFPYPPANPPFSGSVGRRLQAAIADVEPAQNPGALYFAEVHVVGPDDAQAGNGLNNTSHRRVTFTANDTGATMALAGTTVRETPILRAWQDHGLGANRPDPDVHLVPVDYAETGPAGPIAARFWIAAKAGQNEDGSWHYEYALHNLNSHRSARSILVPLPPGITATNIGFHDVAYHSGEPFDGTDWAAAVEPGAILWSTQTFEENQDANALRWGTVYNYRFDADAAPADGMVTIGLFRPGAAGEPEVLTATLPVPGGGCRADYDGSGQVTSDDYFSFLTDYFAGSADFNNDGVTTSDDFFEFLDAFFKGC